MADLLVGLIAGLLGGLVGVGGGVIIVPLMTETLKFRQHEAHGTSLIAVVFTGVAGSIIYYLHGSVDLGAAAVLAGMALITVRLGAKYCCFLAEMTLKRDFGFFLLFVALLFLLKPFLPYVMDGVPPVWIRWIVLVLLGALTGFISGMMGVGGGSFMIPIMVIFAGIAQHTAQGISLLAMIPASTVGAWTHWQEGNIRSEPPARSRRGRPRRGLCRWKLCPPHPGEGTAPPLCGPPPLHGPPVSADKKRVGGGLHSTKR